MVHDEFVKNGDPLVRYQRMNHSVVFLLCLIPILILMNIVGILNDGYIWIEKINSATLVVLIVMTIGLSRINKRAKRDNRLTSSMRIGIALYQKYGFTLEEGLSGDTSFLLNRKGDNATSETFRARTAYGEDVEVNISLSDDYTDLIATRPNGDPIPMYYGFEKH